MDCIYGMDACSDYQGAGPGIRKGRMGGHPHPDRLIRKEGMSGTWTQSYGFFFSAASTAFLKTTTASSLGDFSASSAA